ncbi:MAG: DUF2958 domain-containing protein [Pyrinomonadaceae bacterium]
MSRLLNDVLSSRLPKLRSQEDSADPIVYARFFFPASGWAWFVTEGEAQVNELLFFGYVIGFEREWGYFTLRELEEVEVCGMKIERDLDFEPAPFSKSVTEPNFQQQ